MHRQKLQNKKNKKTFDVFYYSPCIPQIISQIYSLYRYANFTVCLYYIRYVQVAGHWPAPVLSFRRRVHEGGVRGNGIPSSGDSAQLCGAESLRIVRAQRHELTGGRRGRSHVRAGRHGRPAGRERALTRHHDHTGPAHCQMMRPALGEEGSEGWGQIFPNLFYSSL